mmetsp:Transcript_122480/g.280726  ORF Transcript_122480/g.280726 Transcript_122480/m.280726 type:complete len:321 (+) Transcript_122480:1613-2575(+)
MRERRCRGLSRRPHRTPSAPSQRTPEQEPPPPLGTTTQVTWASRLPRLACLPASAGCPTSAPRQGLAAREPHFPLSPRGWGCPRRRRSHSGRSGWRQRSASASRHRWLVREPSKRLPTPGPRRRGDDRRRSKLSASRNSPGLRCLRKRPSACTKRPSASSGRSTGSSRASRRRCRRSSSGRRSSRLLRASTKKCLQRSRRRDWSSSVCTSSNGSNSGNNSRPTGTTPTSTARRASSTSSPLRRTTRMRSTISSGTPSTSSGIRNTRSIMPACMAAVPLDQRPLPSLAQRPSLVLWSLTLLGNNSLPTRCAPRSGLKCPRW